MTALDPNKYPINKLLAHEVPMLLLDEVLEINDNSIRVRVDMNKPSIFTDAKGNVPSYVGIEYMAQATGALIGYFQLEQKKPIKIGFLLGSRHYDCSTPHFKPDQDLIIQVTEHMRDNELGIFNCEIHSDRCIAKAQIKAIQPENLDDYI